MRLTFRQKVFLSKLLDAYRDMKEPVHYSVIADRLSLNNSTAYDMLRLLEQKGMVASVYDAPKKIAGPGRSSVRFVPTAETTDLFSKLAGDVREQDEWDDIKTRVLTNLSKGVNDDYKDLFDELLARIPEPSSSLVLCAEVITALLLNLKESKRELAQQSYLDSLLKTPATKLRMSVLAGLILGLSFTDHETQRLIGIYQQYVEKYEASLDQLNRDSLVKLHRFTRNVWNILRTPSF
ncbi:MAG: hypothetical protein ACRKGH_07580 [Dehalogenimonas sp.]